MKHLYKLSFLILLIPIFIVACTNNQLEVNSDKIVESMDSSDPYPWDYNLNVIVYDEERGLMAKKRLEYDIFVELSHIDAYREIHYDIY